MQATVKKRVGKTETIALTPAAPQHQLDILNIMSQLFEKVGKNQILGITVLIDTPGKNYEILQAGSLRNAHENAGRLLEMAIQSLVNSEDDPQ